MARSVLYQQIQDYENKGYGLVCVDARGQSPKGRHGYGKHNWGEKGRTNVIGALAGPLTHRFLV